MEKKKGENASIIKRILAYFIDNIIISIIVIFPFKGVFNNGLSNLENIFTFRSTDPLFYLSFSIIAILSLTYWSILEYKTQQSIGKMIMNLKVISQKKNLELWQCIIRNLSKPFSFFLVIDTFILLLTRKQRLLDKIAYTEVIKI